MIEGLNNLNSYQDHYSSAPSCWMLKYLIWQALFPVAITYKNSLKLCFFKYFLVKYFKYLFENGMLAETVILLASFETFTCSPKLPTLPSTFILAFKNSLKLVVLKTLSSTGLEQSIEKLWLTFFYWATFLLMVKTLLIIIFNLFIHLFIFQFPFITQLKKQHCFFIKCQFTKDYHNIQLDLLLIQWINYRVIPILFLSIIQNLRKLQLYNLMTSTQPSNFNQPQSLVKYSNPVLVSSSGKKQIKDSKANTGNTYTEDILNSILPPRQYTTEKQQLWIQSVSATPATKQDVLDLQQKLDKRLQQRQARETGICPIREELYSQCFDELIRQITINCAERGLLLVRVRDEIRSTIQSYQTLYESSIAFGMRRALQAEQKKKDMETKISTLRAQTKELEDQVNQLEDTINEMEKRDKEEQEQSKQAHKNDVEAQKRTNQILKEELEKLLQGPQQAKK